MQANSRLHNYFSFIWPFESGKCGKEGEYKKLNISRTDELLDKIKAIFHNFRNAFFGKI